MAPTTRSSTVPSGSKHKTADENVRPSKQGIRKEDGKCASLASTRRKNFTQTSSKISDGVAPMTIYNKDDINNSDDEAVTTDVIQTTDTQEAATLPQSNDHFHVPAFIPKPSRPSKDTRGAYRAGHITHACNAANDSIAARQKKDNLINNTRRLAAGVKRGLKSVEGKHSRLFEFICIAPSDEKIREQIVEWNGAFDDDPHGSVVDLINLILEAAGFPHSMIVKADAEDKPREEVIDEMVAAADKQNIDISDYPILNSAANRNRIYKLLKMNFITFWKSIITTCDRVAVVSNILSELESWLISLSSSKIRCLRHAATTACFAVCDGILLCYRDWASEISLSKRQYESESQRSCSAELREIEENIKSGEMGSKALIRCLTSFFHGVFVYRTKDVAACIRLEAVEALCRWSTLAPTRFLAVDSYVKVLGFALYDEELSIRAASISFIESIASNANAWASLKESCFNRMFADQVVTLIKASDTSVTINSIKYLKRLEEEKILTDEQVEAVSSCLWEDTSIDTILPYLADFIDSAFFTFSICRQDNLLASEANQPKQNTSGMSNALAEGYEVHLRDLKSFIQLTDLFKNASQEVLVERLVKAFWMKAPVFRNFRLLIDLLVVSVGADDIFQPLEPVYFQPLLRIIHAVLNNLIDDEKTSSSDKLKGTSTSSNSACETSASLSFACVAFLDSLPKLLRIFKAEPPSLELIACCTFLAAPQIAKVRSQINVSEILSSMSDIFKHHSDPKILDPIAAALSKIHSSAKQDSHLVQSTFHGLLNFSRTEFKTSFTSWQSIIRQLSSNDSSDDNATYANDAHKIFTLILVSIRRLSALTKSGISNPFSGNWILLDYLLEILAHNTDYAKYHSKSGETLTYGRRDSRKLKAASMGLRLLASEVLMAAYLHIYCDIVESCHGLGTATNEANEGEEDDNFNFRFAARKRCNPTDEEDGEDSDGHQKKRRRLEMAGRLFGLDKVKSGKPIDALCTVGVVSDISIEQMDVEKLYGKTKKLFDILVQLKQSMIQKYMEILGGNEGSNGGSETRIWVDDIAKIDSCACLMHIVSLDKIMEYMIDYCEDSSASLAKAVVSKKDETSQKAVARFDSLTNLFKVSQQQTQQKEIAGKIFPFYKHILGHSVDVSAEVVKPVTVSQYDVQSSFLISCSKRIWGCVDRTKDIAGSLLLDEDATLDTLEDCDAKVEQQQPLEFLLPSDIVWAAEFLSRCIANTYDTCFWDTQMASFLLTMLTESERIELRQSAESLLHAWKCLADWPIVWRRIFYSVKTLFLLEPKSLEDFSSLIYRNLGLSYLKDSKGEFCQFIIQCLELLFEDIGTIEKCDRYTDFFRGITPLMQRKILGPKEEELITSKIIELCTGKELSAEMSKGLRYFVPKLLTKQMSDELKELLCDKKPLPATRRPHRRRRRQYEGDTSSSSSDSPADSTDEEINRDCVEEVREKGVESEEVRNKSSNKGLTNGNRITSTRHVDTRQDAAAESAKQEEPRRHTRRTRVSNQCGLVSVPSALLVAEKQNREVSPDSTGNCDSISPTLQTPQSPPKKSKKQKSSCEASVSSLGLEGCLSTGMTLGSSSLLSIDYDTATQDDGSVSPTPQTNE